MHFFLRVLRCLVAAGIVVAALPAVAQDIFGSFSVTGALSYRARSALPENATAVIDLRADGAVVAQQAIDLEGRQVPVSFDLAVERGALPDSDIASLIGTILVEGHIAWMTDPVSVDTSGISRDLGTLMMMPHGTLAFAKRYTCGNQRLTFGLAGGMMVLRTEAEDVILTPSPGDDVARYTAADGADTAMVPQGDTAKVRLAGNDLPVCLVGDTPMPTELAGAEWVVTAIDGLDTLPDTDVTMTFGTDGVVAGRASCNTYSAGFETDGNTVELSAGSATLMACTGDGVMEQERSFLDILAAATRYTIAEDGSLTLSTEDGRTIGGRLVP